ncbi:MAG: hypothetical protein K8R99_07345 [Actinomycetia bacterium]|nr:hypothetical protein [Actinomycetes bacterium]
MSLRANIAVGVAVARRPRLWRAALAQWRRTTPRQWWRRRPFLPMPSGDYMRFRTVTQYGDANHALVPDDVLNYLEWCRVQARLK